MIQETIAKYKLPDTIYKLRDQIYKAKNLNSISNTQSNHIQFISKKQTEGLAHHALFQLANPKYKQSNSDSPDNTVNNPEWYHCFFRTSATFDTKLDSLTRSIAQTTGTTCTATDLKFRLPSESPEPCSYSTKKAENTKVIEFYARKLYMAFGSNYLIKPLLVTIISL